MLVEQVAHELGEVMREVLVAEHERDDRADEADLAAVPHRRQREEPPQRLAQRRRRALECRGLLEHSGGGGGVKVDKRLVGGAVPPERAQVQLRRLEQLHHHRLAHLCPVQLGHALGHLGALLRRLLAAAAGRGRRAGLARSGGLLRLLYQPRGEKGRLLERLPHLSQLSVRRERRQGALAALHCARQAGKHNLRRPRALRRAGPPKVDQRAVRGIEARVLRDCRGIVLDSLRRIGEGVEKAVAVGGELGGREGGEWEREEGSASGRWERGASVFGLYIVGHHLDHQVPADESGLRAFEESG